MLQEIVQLDTPPQLTTTRLGRLMVTSPRLAGDPSTAPPLSADRPCLRAPLALLHMFAASTRRSNPQRCHVPTIHVMCIHLPSTINHTMGQLDGNQRLMDSQLKRTWYLRVMAGDFNTTLYDQEGRGVDFVRGGLDTPREMRDDAIEDLGHGDNDDAFRTKRAGRHSDHTDHDVSIDLVRGRVTLPLRSALRESRT